jgi:4-hydroxy-tetrahydrodipicolinate synthase
MYEKRLLGVVIPMITPMNEDGTIDDASLANFTRFLADAGVNALYPNGTNGESLLLSKEERDHVTEVIAKENAHKLPLFIQCGSMTTAETAAHAKHAVQVGADGIGVMSPAFFPMDEQSLYEYYCAVIRELPEDFPVYIYNIPGCTTSDVKPALLRKLMAEFPNVVGIKYSCPDLMRVEDYLNTDGRKPELLIGCDSLFLQCLMTGGVGTVTGPGSIFYERFNRLYRQYQEGDYKGAAETQRKIVETDRKLANIPGIPALKTLLKLRGVIRTDVCRAPLRPLSAEEYKILEEVYAEYCKEEGIHE